MNYEYENSSSGSTFLEELTKANGEVLEAREQVPYQPVVYAIPEEWRLAEKALLEQAVQFQPSIYQALQNLATGQVLEQMQTALTQILRTEKLETLRSIRTTLEQAGANLGAVLGLTIGAVMALTEEEEIEEQEYVNERYAEEETRREQSM